MVAFAANSLLCRLALKHTGVDAASFTFIRIFSGAAVLLLIMKLRNAAWKVAGNWTSALALLRLCRRLFRLPTTASPPEPARCSSLGRSGHDDSLGLAQRRTPALAQLVGLALALGGLVVLLFPVFRPRG